MPTALKKKQTLLIIASFGAITLVAVIAFFVFTQPKSSTNTKDTVTNTNQASQSAKSTNTSSSDITWQWNDSEWFSNKTPPACSNPLLTELPVDINLVTAILYPGQIRGGDYKAHGGFRFSDSSNLIQVKIPLDSVVTSASRYIQDGEVQYFFNFVNSCGLAYRFDHLLTLTEKFQKIAESLPEAKPDDSRTTKIEPPVKVTRGELVASAIGFEKTKNVFVDFGVYDLRTPNLASKKPNFASTYANSKEFIFYGICWLNEYPTEISTKLKALPAGDGASSKTSDYCT